MKNVKQYKNQLRLGILLILIILSVASISIILKAINNFFDQNYIQFNRVINIEIKAPFEIKKRAENPQEVIKIVEQLPKLEEVNSDIEKYICDKWGIYQCQVALAVAKAESGLKEDAFNVNSNGSIDVGIFQINSVHYKKQGCSLKEIIDPYKNVDCAYEIYQSSGWNAWSVYNNGSFKFKIK